MKGENKMVNATTIVSEIEFKTMSKVNKRLIPYLILLYLFCMLDRVNVGFAALTMNADLGINSAQYGLVAGIFFVGYFIFEVPSNIIMTKVGARKWIARILISWGIVSAMCGLIHTATHLYIIRFLLGAMEAGFYPGIMLYMTFWFPAKERAKVVSLFMLAIPLSSMFGAPLSGLILDHIHWLNLSSWRWLFFMEGIPTFLAGVVTLIVLPNRPNEAKWLKESEKKWLTDTIIKEHESIAKKHKQSKWKALTGGTTWLLAIIYFSKTMALYGVSFFAPTLIKSITVGLSNFQIGLVNGIPLIFGCIFMVLWSRHSDKTGERRYHVAISLSICFIGLIGIGLTSNPYFSVFFLTLTNCGVYGIYGSFWAMTGMVFTEEYAAIAMASINSIANLGGFIGPMAIGALKTATGSSYYGFYSIAGFIMVSVGITLSLKFIGSDVYNDGKLFENKT